MLQINGTTVKEPQAITWGIEDIDGEAYRNAKGKMIRDRIGRKRTLEIQWGALSDAEISTILQASKGTSFSVYYPDAMDGSYATRTFYVGERTAPIYSLVGHLPKWENLSMSLIEI